MREYRACNGWLIVEGLIEMNDAHRTAISDKILMEFPISGIDFRKAINQMCKAPMLDAWIETRSTIAFMIADTVDARPPVLTDRHQQCIILQSWARRTLMSHQQEDPVGRTSAGYQGLCQRQCPVDTRQDTQHNSQVSPPFGSIYAKLQQVLLHWL